MLLIALKQFSTFVLIVFFQRVLRMLLIALKRSGGFDTTAFLRVLRMLLIALKLYLQQKANAP